MRSANEPGPRRGFAARELRRRWWTGSWRAALRLAARDARRHRGSSSLIVVMVGLPVLLITAASAYLATTLVTVDESVPVTLGHAQARLEDNRSGPLTQNARAEVLSYEDPEGRVDGQPRTRAQLESLTGGTLAQVAYPDLYAGVGSDLLRVHSLAMDSVALPASGLATLVSGRWPQGADEVAVTDSGAEAGLATTGVLSLRAGDSAPRDVQVTGVVRAVDPTYQPVGLVTGASWIPADEPAQFLLSRDRAVTWGDVRAWNAYGLVVLSKAVLADPPAAAADPQSDNGFGVAIVVLICLGLVLETTLLAGPAFAVSAARRRRSLSLVASNGADRDQLRRYVLAQGVVLGGGAVLVGCLAGIAAGWAAVRIAAHWVPSIGHPPLDTYAALTTLVVVAAVLASLVAASLPARGAARLALAATLDGQGELRHPSSRLPTVGTLVLLTGLAGVGLSLLMSSSMAQLFLSGAAGAVALLGVLMLVPGLLRLLGAWLRRGPVTLRMAARDTSRARSRSTPAIAAVTVAVAVMTVASVSATSDDAQARRDYQPRGVAGQGLVCCGAVDTTAPATLGEIRRQQPTWLVEPVGTLGTPEYREGSGTVSVVSAVPPGCSAAVAIAKPAEDTPAPDPCQILGSNSGAFIYSHPAAALDSRAALTPAQQRTLADGGVLVTSPGLVSDGRMRIAVGSYRLPEGDQRRLLRQVDVPAAVVEPGQLRAATHGQDSFDSAGLMLSSTAAGLDLPTYEQGWVVIDPDGPISRSDQSSINEHVVVGLEVERGFESPIAIVVRVLLGLAAALVAVAALISTALAQSEARADFATMSALGATASFRRRLAAGQALLVALTGTVLGLTVGLLPGVSMARSLTTEQAGIVGAGFSPPGPPIVDVPWLGLAVVVVGVPLLAALVAAVAVRRRPVLTRRLT